MKKVFFCDDDPDFLSLVEVLAPSQFQCEALTSTGFASTLKKKKEVLNSRLAFLDVNLGPDVPTGIEVYKWLRTQGYDKPIYFLTGHAKNSGELRSIEGTGDAIVLAKPMPVAILQEIIGAIQ